MRRILIAALLSVISSQAIAQQFFAAAANPRLQINLEETDVQFGLVNWDSNITSISLGTNLPSVLSSDGYPVTNLSVAVSGSYAKLPTPAQYSGTWEIGWSGTGAKVIPVTVTIVSDPQGCYQGSSKFVGTNCDVVFSFGSNPGTGFSFPIGTYSGMSGAFLIRSTDKTAYLACVAGNYSQCFTPEYIAMMQGLGPIPVLRTMGMNFPSQAGGNNNEASWGARTPVTEFGYFHGNWYPDLWAGTATGTDQYTLGSYPNMPISWTDGEEFQANFTNAADTALKIGSAVSNGGLVQLVLTGGTTTANLLPNQQIMVASQATCPTYTLGTSGKPVVYSIATVDDGTHLTLSGTTFAAAWSGCNGIISTTTVNVGTRGAKFVTDMNVTNGVGSSTASTIGAGANGTLIYDGNLGVLLYAVGGIQSGIPKEVQAGIANALNVPLWMNIPQHYDNASAISLVTFLNGYLARDLFLEYGNEDWNFAFLAQWIQQRGMALGLTTGSGEALYSFTGLRSRQLFGLAQSAWSRNASTLHLILGGQSTGTATLFQTYEFHGSALCGTSCSNPVYQALIGVDYNASPNRPYDLLGASGAYVMASYFHGPQEAGGSGTLVQLAGSCNGTTCTGILAAATCYASPSNTTCGTGGGQQTALQYMYDDTYNGTFTDGTGGKESVEWSQSNTYGPWNAVAAADSVNLDAYEGGDDSPGITASYLISIGDTSSASCTPCNGGTTDSANIASLITAFKFSSQFYAIIYAWNTQFFTNSQAKYNSWFAVGAGLTPSQWSLLQSVFPPVTTLAPYQSYYAVGALNKGLQ